MDAYADLKDLQSGWRELSTEEQERASVLLERVSDYIALRLSNKGIDPDTKGDLYQSNLVDTICDVTRRMLGEDDVVTDTVEWAQMTTPYSQSFNAAKTLVEKYMTKEQKKTLGIYGARFGSVSMQGDDE